MNTPDMHPNEQQRASVAASIGLALLGRYKSRGPIYRVYRMHCGHNDVLVDRDLFATADLMKEAPDYAVRCRACQGRPTLLDPSHPIEPLRTVPAKRKPRRIQWEHNESATPAAPPESAPHDVPPSLSEPLATSAHRVTLTAIIQRLDDGDAAFAQLVNLIRAELDEIRAHVGMPPVVAPTDTGATK